ncbi:hypothetical protein SAMN05660461_4792 [Chitinophaga ginsengisegetis]|uniref:Import component protein n=1 Tax=Chitinophaga ginsengisegetis TaxID=393003 RepID=A0A1T5P837_9BACT|nr:import component protein [Chitinophaga ginsengisegetis]MDR6567965.1 putative membrane protein [Chitinophaga ginsengisegetis]MDR6647480.1 putative membrane protein [Chitinophaga ginsengisegetis]MDR6653830.1 putative membrane protein [Chitinophaga ginsengisegetis]SKD08915.1 hypothetical protein SAMN05660461_4792 [Chitinophaga ginsengisegetis]
MNSKTLSILSYVTLIGWLIAYFSGKEKSDSLLRYHLRQSLGLAIVSILLNITLTIIAHVVPSLSFLGLIGYVILIFWILGIINAANQAEKPVPVFGKVFENKFSFIN